jgi:hypothetical protein
MSQSILGECITRVFSTGIKISSEIKPLSKKIKKFQEFKRVPLPFNIV